jgi:RNA polymerase sigma-70 factor, ECF subfamily
MSQPPDSSPSSQPTPPVPVASEGPELAIRRAFDAGKYEAAATAALQAYGQEVLSFIQVRLREPGDAQEAFSMFAEDLWNGLPKFSWRCAMRTWCYTLARNAATRFAISPQRRPARNNGLSHPDAYSKLIHHVRSGTRMYQRTDVKDAFRALRERLDPEDQAILILRVDRGLSFRELAMTLSGDIELDDAALARETARLRKAFERIKEELKRMAQAEGLLPVKQ